ncbi:MAG: DUF362 domain-containing protein [Desulfobacula sp.]|nr:DUF362 domain-containing protein [Desulfobacula sp.]
MTADVYFMDLEATSKENLPEKLLRLVKKTGLAQRLDKNDLTAVKIHFGEQGNTAYIRPVFIRKIILAIKECGASPFLTDANTLYLGTRSDSVSHIHTAIENGFSYSSMDSTPIIIADGLRGKNETAVMVGQKNCEHVYIGSEIINSDSLVSVAHFKGHELSGFGGTLKNLGMGCASRRGKLDQHSNVSPKIKRKTCIGCRECENHCPSQAIYLKENKLKEKKAYIDKTKCIGCAECIVRCPTESVNINWNQTVPVFLEKMMEYTLGVLKDKKNKTLFINFITDIAPKCDCLPYSEAPIVNNVGVLASTDPVAIDQAGADLVNQQQALPNTSLKTNHKPGEDKFKGLYPSVDWEHQLDYAESLSLGTRKYKLIKLKTLAYKKS